jgi:leucyl aminopeptidase
MLDQSLDCLAASGEGARPIHLIRPDGLARFIATLPEAQMAFLRGSGFTAKAGELQLLPGPDGVTGAVVGLGTDTSPFATGDLATRLPSALTWRLEPGDFDMESAVLGYCLGAYRYTRFKEAKEQLAPLFAPDAPQQSLWQSEAVWMVRDLINAPPNVLGPEELATFTASLAQRFGCTPRVVTGADLEDAYPTVAMVGQGSARKPHVVTFRWRGSAAADDAPLISLCGKGVCFDTGGYDLKPSAGMLRMKKDMGGAAAVLGLARIIMQADLPVHLAVRIGCVENSVSGTAMRPSDIIKTRSGLTVEVGNTDAEGRLVLCDLLDEACHENPAIVIDCATLTGAARVALGPDLPALFCNDDGLADAMVATGFATHDPVWRLPLWAGYDSWMNSSIADVNNNASKPMAGSITAALYLQRFVKPGVPWMHFDLYAWNDQNRPGRPEGGEAMTVRSLFAFLESQYVKS